MGYIPSPQEAIVDNEIRMAKAEQKASNNVWTKYVIPIGSQLLTSAIKGGVFSGGGGKMDMGESMDFTSPDNGASDMGLKGGGGFMDPSSFSSGQYGTAVAALGKSNAKGDIEVEGGEVLDMNGLDPVEIQGARHEQGGVDVTVPSGTKIFSDRLKGPDGKTMAERKKRRESQMKKIEDILSDNSTDLAVKNAYERKKTVVEQEEAQDLMMQQMADTYDKMRGADMYALGTGPDGTDPWVLYGQDRKPLFDFSNMDEGQIALAQANMAKEKYNSAIKGTDANFAGDAAQTASVNKSIADSNKATEKALNIAGGSPSTNDAVDLYGIQYSKGYGDKDFSGYLSQYLKDNNIETPDWADVRNRKAFQKLIGTKEDGIFGPDTLAKAQAYYSNRQQPVTAVPQVDTGVSPDLTSKIEESAGTIPGAKTGEVVPDGSVSDTGVTTDKPSLATGDYNNAGKISIGGAGKEGSGNEDPEDKNAWWKSLIPAMTGGDLLSLYGNFLGTTDPLKNVLENRAGDQPNVNHFRNFGKDALESLNKQKGYIEGQKSNALMKLMLSNAASKKSMRGSARGVNTLRALDLAADLNKDIAGNDVQNNFAQQMMQLFGQETQLENLQDQMVMSGEERRDLADRQDRDQFYTNKGIALNAKSRGMQEMGKDVNKLYENQMTKNLINQIGKYFEYDKNGNLKNIKKESDINKENKNKTSGEDIAYNSKTKTFTINGAEYTQEELEKYLQQKSGK